jgi:serralysin
MWRMLGCALALLLFAPAFAQAPQRLDRTGLQPTFADEFDTLNLADPRRPETWTARNWKTWFDNSEDPFNLHNRTLPNNGENQAYTDSGWPERVGSFPNTAHTVENGILRLRADRTPPSLRPRVHGKMFTSGMINGWGTHAQRYGVFEARLKLPKGRGLWPAFWMIQADGPVPPEIDIMEFLGHTPNSIWVVNHSMQKGKHTARSREVLFAQDMTKDFHVYSVDWRPTTTNFYIDDVLVMTIPTPADMHKPMYMILNLAVGGRWGGLPDAQTVFPAYYEVDWVRAWRRPGVHDAPAPAPRPKAKKK